MQVNLRSETYAQGSRIPKMEFGTPEQDALRRDFTINSLFYNINQVGALQGDAQLPAPPSKLEETLKNCLRKRQKPFLSIVS